MKTKISLVSALMLVVCFMPLKNSGQEVLTIGEVYDFEVGDVFHTSSWAYVSGGGGYSRFTNIEIIEKYFSPNNDTVFYVEEIIFEEAGTGYPWYIEEYVDTVFYYYFYSLLPEIDSIYSDPLFCNGRIVNFRYDTTDYYIETNSYVQGCGKASNYFYSWEGSEVHSFYYLIYYNKSGEEWGTPHIVVGMDDKSMDQKYFQIFPNPATTFITIHIKEGIAIEEAIIYNHLGQKALVAVPVNNTVDVSKLKPGIYILEVVTENRTIREKLMVE